MYRSLRIQYASVDFPYLLIVMQLCDKSGNGTKRISDQYLHFAILRSTCILTLVKIIIIIKLIVAAVMVVKILACVLRKTSPPPDIEAITEIR